MTTIRPGIADNSWEMTTIRPYSPNAIENFDSELETIPDGINTNPDDFNTNLRSRHILGIVVLSIGSCALAGIVIVFSVLSATHSL
jgi:hypothetical protein